MLDFIQSENGIAIVGAVIGAVWTLFKGSDWYQQRLARKWNRAILVLEAAVEQTYETYVREIKAASEDGVLTSGERAEARRRATNTAIAIGRSQGIDIVRILGDTYLPLWISKVVESRDMGGVVESPFGR